MADPDRFFLDSEAITRTYEVVRQVESEPQNLRANLRGHKDPHPQRWIPFTNSSTAAAPAFALLKVTGITAATGTLTVTQASTEFSRVYAINGPDVAAANGGSGLCTLDSPCLCAYDSGTPAVGEGWGPKPGQWTLSKGFPGGTVIGIHDSANSVASVMLETPIVNFLGKTTAATTANAATTSYNVMAGGTLGSETNAGFNPVPSALSLTTIGSSKWVKLTFLANGVRMEPLECG